MSLLSVVFPHKHMHQRKGASESDPCKTDNMVSGEEQDSCSERSEHCFLSLQQAMASSHGTCLFQILHVSGSQETIFHQQLSVIKLHYIAFPFPFLHLCLHQLLRMFAPQAR